MLERPRFLRPLLLVVVGLGATLALFQAWRWWSTKPWIDAPLTSVDTLMQDPTEWLGRLVQLEGTIDAGRTKDTWLECSYRLREGWKSVEVRGSGCGWTPARHGRQAFATGTLRRDGGSFFFDAVQVGGNLEEFDHVRYFQPPAAQRVSEASVIGQADAFRRRVAARAPGSGAPDAVRLLRKAFMHGCFLRFDGSAGCWHNHQWNREKQDTPSELYAVEGAPPLTSLDLNFYSGAGLTANGEVYWFSAPRTDQSDARVPNAPPGQALRVNVQKALSVRLGADACALLENGRVACWDHDGTARETTARVADSECVLRDGVVACKGSNWFGELGVARFSTTRRDFEEWVPVATSEPVVEVAAGGRHKCVQLASGWVECWGANENGQASPFAPLMSSARPLRVARFPLDWELSAHEDLTCMSRGGAFECWGFCAQLPQIPDVACTTWPGGD